MAAFTEIRVIDHKDLWEIFLSTLQRRTETTVVAFCTEPIRIQRPGIYHISKDGYKAEVMTNEPIAGLRVFWKERLDRIDVDTDGKAMFYTVGNRISRHPSNFVDIVVDVPDRYREKVSQTFGEFAILRLKAGEFYSLRG